MLRCEPVVVLGCGSIGRRHARNLLSAGVQQICVVDPDPEAARSVAAECQADVAASLDQALARGAATVFICTPSDLHADEALRAARAGADLFVEKPLSHSLEQLDDLERIATEHRLVTMVGCNMRFHPGPRAIKMLLHEGTVGRILAARIHTGSYLPRWRPTQDYRRSYSASADHGGALLDCIHEIDLALWYFGPAKLLASASMPASSLGLETDGLAELMMQHENGVLSSLHLNFVQRDYCRSCMAIGTEGTIEWVFRDREVRVFGDDGTITWRIPEPEHWDMNQMYIDELAHFLDATERRVDTMNPIRGGIEALRLATDARLRSFEAPA